MTTLADPSQPTDRHIQVWFDKRLIADSSSDAQRADSAAQRPEEARRAAPQRNPSPLPRRAPTGVSGGSDRPVLLGYLRRDLLVADSQVGVLRREMTQFAEVEGFTIGRIHVEYPGSWLAAFERLVLSISCHGVIAVVLPSLLHLIGIGLGTPTDVRSIFERATGAHVLVLPA
ncbi:MAG TPA: hypothetical protein VGL05_34965 [Kribbella sp.]